MTTYDSYLGKGLYSYGDAGRILGISTGKIHNWTDGYRNMPPMFGRELAEPHILTFVDLMQLLLVQAFRKDRFSLQTIRAIAQYVARQCNTDHPFGIMRFHRSGKAIIGEMLDASPSDKHGLYMELPRAQVVMGEVITPYLEERLVYSNTGKVAQYWPMGMDGGVVIDPRRSFGEPILADYGLPTYTLYRMHMAGDSPEILADAFCVSTLEVEQALNYERGQARAA